MISTIILTRNEENDLPRCLRSLAWCDDVHVLDSGSTDRTIEIAQHSNAKTAEHPFESFGKQRNHALDHLPIKHEWVLFLDADELATEAFRDELVSKLTNATDDVAGFYCCWKMILESRWLKRCDNFPKWQFRVLRKGRAKFTDFGHGQKEGDIDGHISYIKQPYLHYGFSKGWLHWIDRHNRYSSLEARARLAGGRRFADIFSRSASRRNSSLKLYLTRLPGWPLLRFFHTYIMRFGFVEGVPGFIYCCNMAYYEFLIKIKMRELRRADTDLISEN